MSKTFVSGGGDKVKLYVALLPLGDRTEPQDVDIETSAAAAINATTITVDTLTGSIAAGTPLSFVDANDIFAAYLAKDAKAGDTQLMVEPLAVAIPTGAIAEYVAKQRLLGGTQMSVATNAERTETMVFEDPLGYSDGVVTKQSWNVPWTANLLATDEAYQRVYYANVNAVSGREVYIWQQDPPPAGYSIGDGLKGVSVVTNFTKEMPSDGIVTFNCEFTGNGAPTITRYKL
ncbi:No_hits_found [Calothrix sp. PCC 7716]|nr:No_hits_found [Calothrix sp. PCC 7716]